MLARLALRSDLMNCSPGSCSFQSVVCSLMIHAVVIRTVQQECPIYLKWDDENTDQCA